MKRNFRNWIKKTGYCTSLVFVFYTLFTFKYEDKHSSHTNSATDYFDLPFITQHKNNSQLKHQISPIHLTIVDPYKNSMSNKSYKCLDTRTEPSFKICIYDISVDKYISGSLLHNGIWEPHITRLFQLAVRNSPIAGVIDIGANIGYYSLLAAAMGHRVVAVEPLLENRLHLQKAIRISHYENTVTVIAGAVYKQCRKVTMTSNADNQGGVWIDTESSNFGEEMSGEQTVDAFIADHLLQVISFSEAIIKIDIEGFECTAIQEAKKLLRLLKVPYIFMEWQKMFKQRYYQDTPCSTGNIESVVRYLVSLGYMPYEVRTGFQLNPDRCSTSWKVGDIYWQKRSAINLQDPY